MSRLAARIARLEQRLAGCPLCAERKQPVVLVYAGAAGGSSAEDTRPCPACGAEPPEPLQVRLAFTRGPEERA